MLVLQHIIARWDKATRGANGPVRRPRLAPVYALPAHDGGAIDGRTEMLLHQVHSDMIFGQPGPTESIGAIARADWLRSHPALGWLAHPDRVDIGLSNPSEHRLQTRWPAHLPRPLFALERGETARIEWNGRFRTSLFGSNRASYYEQHVYWLAFTDAPTERLFLDAQPKKVIDLTGHMY
ncbi:hypothetical protein [Sphingopyxis sp. KK2]|uniref:hypothetical protein n=1 Tax=Sphingopyxis sp. KK2 TaxID=1855727 RepID=UPI00097E6286|nr:hypothetical protein [Sphingopyxis sp. KK2]